MIPNKIAVNEKFARLAGYFAGEGWIRHNHGFELGFGFNSTEEDFINEVKKLFKQIFNVELHESRQKSVTILRVCAAPLYYLFQTLFGENSLKRKVPAYLLEAPLAVETAFIETLLNSDAHKTKEFRTLSTASEQLAFQVRQMMFRAGHVPSFYKSKNGKTDKPIYKLHWRNSGNYQNGWIEKDFAFFPIRSIERMPYNGIVYNLEVENQHSYAGLTGLFHNCLSAKDLGPEVWRKGGTYWGYTEIVSFTTDALDAFRESFNCGFSYRFLEGDTRQNALSRAKETFTRLAFQLVETGRTLAAICMRENGDNLVYLDAHKPEEKEGCLLGVLRLLPRLTFRPGVFSS